MIICISGLAGSGKTTVSNILISNFIKAGREVLHINSDLVAKKIYLKKYGIGDQNNADYEDFELETIYASMFEIIEKVVKYSPETVVITDGMYRKTSQRILLEVIAEKLDQKFVQIKVDVDPKVALKRVNERFEKEGLGGFVDPSNYEEIYSRDSVLIKNNHTIESLNKCVDKIFKKISDDYASSNIYLKSKSLKFNF